MMIRILFGLSMLLAGSSMAAAQTAASGFPDTKVIPIETPAPTKQSGEDIQRQLTTNLTNAGYTNVTVEPDGFIVGASDKKGEKLVMFLTPEWATVFTAIDAKGANTRTAPPPVTSAK